MTDPVGTKVMANSPQSLNMKVAICNSQTGVYNNGFLLARGRFDHNTLSANRQYPDTLVTAERRCDETKQPTYNTLLSKEASVMQIKVLGKQYKQRREELSSRHLNK